MVRGAAMYDNDWFTLSHNFIVYFCIFNSIYHKKASLFSGNTIPLCKNTRSYFISFLNIFTNVNFQIKNKNLTKKRYTSFYMQFCISTYKSLKKLYNSKDD